MSEFIGALTRHIKRGVSIAVAIGGENYEFIDSSDVLAVESLGAGKAQLILIDRRLSAVKSFPELTKILIKSEGWVLISQKTLINPAKIRKTLRDPKAKSYVAILDSNRVFPISSAFAAPLKQTLGVKSFQYINPLDVPAYRMLQLGIRNIEKDITTMTREELIENFSTVDGKTVVVSVLIVNFLWQQVQYIRAGNSSPVTGGNVRSLWYIVKPVLDRLATRKKSSHYKTLSSKLAEMVSYRILSYSEFELYDDNQWSIGTKNPHIIIMSEKSSHYYFLRELQRTTGASILASGGQPSTITSEYFTTEFKKNVPDYWKKDTVAVVVLVDYDPFGWSLFDTFIGDLKTFGIKNPSCINNIIVPENYTQSDIDQNHNILQGHVSVSMLKKWMKRTNGVFGKPWGLETGTLLLPRNWPKTKETILSQLKPWFKS